MKKLLIFVLIILCFGCSDKVHTVNKSSGDSLTYLFFKNFDVSHYYVSFYDRNVSKNDNSRIIMARNGDKYYYEYDGTDKRKIIQKEGFKYIINEDLNSYYKEEGQFEDFSLFVLPHDINRLKKSGYKYGRSKVYNFKYDFERYDLEGGSVTYYFKNKKLVYVRSEYVTGSSLLKFDRIKKDFDDSLFDVNDSYNYMSY